VGSLGLRYVPLLPYCLLYEGHELGVACPLRSDPEPDHLALPIGHYVQLDELPPPHLLYIGALLCGGYAESTTMAPPCHL
ncbi:MAG: hypothetical protein QXO68_07040, partial [Conexivisphaerales archaeon]